MKTILQNEGNRRLHNICAVKNHHAKHLAKCFVVNVHFRDGGPSYSAGFHLYKRRYVGEPASPSACAKFNNAYFKDSVGYRIRVWPKNKVVEHDLPLI